MLENVLQTKPGKTCPRQCKLGHRQTGATARLMASCRLTPRRHHRGLLSKATAIFTFSAFTTLSQQATAHVPTTGCPEQEVTETIHGTAALKRMKFCGLS